MGTNDVFVLFHFWYGSVPKRRIIAALNLSFFTEEPALAESRKRLLGGFPVHILQKVFVIAGCVVAFCSTISPFYHAVHLWGSIIPEDMHTSSTYYWSFRATYNYRNLWFGTSSSAEYTFYEHGFYDYVPGPLLSRVLVVMFSAQLAALISGIASAFFNRRILAFAPLAMYSLVTVLMISVNILSVPNLAVDSYQLGYWLAYLAILLFLLSLVSNLAFKKRSITHTPAVVQLQ